MGVDEWGETCQHCSGTGECKCAPCHRDYRDERIQDLLDARDEEDERR
jgi:hypothetical protein